MLHPFESSLLKNFDSSAVALYIYIYIHTYIIHAHIHMLIFLRSIFFYFFNGKLCVELDCLLRQYCYGLNGQACTQRKRKRSS